MKLTIENAPLGTFAPAIGGGHWIKTNRGWKWCTGATFPTPGGDWTGELLAPDQSAPVQEPVALEKLFAELLKGTYSGKESYYNDEQISDACHAKAFEIALVAQRKGIQLYTHPAPAVAQPPADVVRELYETLMAAEFILSELGMGAACEMCNATLNKAKEHGL